MRPTGAGEGEGAGEGQGRGTRVGEEKGERPNGMSTRGRGGGECVVTRPGPAASEPSEEYEPDSSLTSSEKRLSGDSLPTAPAPGPAPPGDTVPAAVAVAMPTVPTVPAATEWPPGSGPGQGGSDGGGVKSEVREPCALDGSLKWKVRPVMGLWPVGLGASGVRQGEALAEPYWASEANAERSAHSDSWGRKPDDEDGRMEEEVSDGGAMEANAVDEPRLC